MVLTLKILVGLSVLIFIIGLIKPKWILFWMKQPDRLSATTVALVLFMASMTGIAKLTMKPRSQQDQQHKTDQRSSDDRNDLQLDRR